MRYEDRYVKDPTGGRIDLQRERYAVGWVCGAPCWMISITVCGSNGFQSALHLGYHGQLFLPGHLQGPYGKTTASINIGQAYMGWRPGTWLDVTLGKMPNPLYTTPLRLVSSLDPEGIAEQFKYTVGQADFFATFGQFVYSEFNPNSASGGLGLNRAERTVGAKYLQLPMKVA